MISREEVEHVAKLSRIKLSKDEVKKFGEQLSSILEFVEKLNEVDTKNANASTSINGISNVWREDEVVPSEIDRKDFLKNAADNKDGFIKTKAVFEE